jgi:predicted nucleic acid-binding protein
LAIILDTWALLAFLKDEPAAPRVEQAWLSDELVMCSVNLGEALYTQIRIEGERAARAAIEDVRAAMTVVDPDWELVSMAAVWKARGGLSYADCFALATARRHNAPLWTGDPEIIAAGGDVSVVDLRSPR